MPNEKRRFTRVAFRVRAILFANDVRYHADEIENISMGGCLLPLDAGPPPGSPCRLRISMTGTTSNLSVEAEGDVIRNLPHAVAIKFTQIPSDSMFHLRNIILYNALDTHKVENELKQPDQSGRGLETNGGLTNEREENFDGRR